MLLLYMVEMVEFCGKSRGVTKLYLTLCTEALRKSIRSPGSSNYGELNRLSMHCVLIRPEVYVPLSTLELLVPVKYKGSDAQA